MSKLPHISGRAARRAFEKMGWVFARQHGSHMILKKEGQHANLSIPDHPELAPGTLRQLLRAAEITPEDFLKRLNG